jgi:hypothetical protein
MNTTTTYPIKRPITIMMDHLIIGQLPKDVRQQLGPIVETGFLLSSGRRDLICEGGVAQYILGSRTIDVTLD